MRQHHELKKVLGERRLLRGARGILSLPFLSLPPSEKQTFYPRLKAQWDVEAILQICSGITPR